VSASEPQVAIAVVSTNLRDLLAACLESMRPEVESGRAEVWVVDNASSDGSPDMVRERFPWANLIASETNLGYGRAINLVTERSNAPWIAPANEDIELRPSALERLLLTGREQPRAAIIAPRLELPDGSTQHSVHAFPTLGLAAYFNLGMYRLSARLADQLCIHGYWDSTRPRKVPWAMATFWLVRRQAFEQIGGFDSEMFIHSEDLDLGWRLSQAGWQSYYEPRATVFHVGSAASKKAFGSEVLWERWMSASYSWMARRRSVPLERAIASINVAGAGARWAWYAPLARLAPGRFAPRRHHVRDWTRVHLTGLRPRRDLLS
jgi:N-acetylglucosaminyl-diphospho-decaprenol L-rhamnosyltransferase